MWSSGRHRFFQILKHTVAWFALSYEGQTLALTTEQEFSQELHRLIAAGGGRGAAVAVIKDGRLIFQEAFGSADLHQHRPVTPETIFHVASVTKIFTGIALLNLEAENLLDLDAPLASIAPDLHIENPYPTPITARHLLEHATGIQEVIPRWLEEKPFSYFSAGEIIRRTISGVTVRWRPGERTVYSNYNYMAAAHVIEQVSGKRFDDYIRAVIFAPAGMKRSTFRILEFAGGDIAKGYMGDPAVELRPTMGAYRIAAGLASSVADLARFLLLVVNDGRSKRDSPLIRPEILAALESPRLSAAARHGLTLGHGAGAVRRPFKDLILVGHNGIVDGFMASMFYNRAAKLGFVILLNAHPLPKAPSLAKIRAAIYQHFFAPGDLITKPPANITGIDGAVADDHLGFYEYSSARFRQLEGFERLVQPRWVSRRGNELVVEDLGGRANRYTPVGKGLFAQAGSPTASLVFGETAAKEKFMQVGPSDFFLRGHAWLYWCTLLVIGSCTVMFLLTPILALWHFRQTRKLEAAALLAWLSFVALVLVVWQVRTSAQALQLNFFTAAIYVLSLAFFLCSWLSLRIPACVLATYFFYYGLIGIKFWDGG